MHSNRQSATWVPREPSLEPGLGAWLTGAAVVALGGAAWALLLVHQGRVVGATPLTVGVGDVRALGLGAAAVADLTPAEFLAAWAVVVAAVVLPGAAPGLAARMA